MIQRFLEWDAQVSRRLRIANQPGVLRSLAIVLAHSGDSWFWGLGLGLVWLLGSEEWKRLALVLLVGVLLTALLVMAIKFTVRRRRPEGEWGGIYRNTDPHSFPSGHAARAVVLAVVTLGVSQSVAALGLGLGLALWAPLVSLARVTMGVHYLSDVLAGGLFGFGMGLLVAAFF